MRQSTGSAPPERKSQRAIPKVQRWIDLLAALLRRRYAASFEELARDVPAYADSARARDAVMRMFERDKDELRHFGIPIQSEFLSDGETHGYRLDRRDFYLPYLSVIAGEERSQPRRVVGDFYRAIETLAFTPDELAVVRQAAARVGELGEQRLASDASSALRKLTFDVPSDLSRADDGVHVVTGGSPVDPELFDTLCDALRVRSAVSFRYAAMSSGSTELREVEGYGIFFLAGYWYLVGRDRARAALRNFRLNRMHDAHPVASSSPDHGYQVPAEFNLQEHARSRSPWELGEGDGTKAVVEFRSRTGAAVVAARLGEPLEGDGDGGWPTRRRFPVRRMDSFARWLLSFGGDAVPIEPPELVDEVSRLARATLAMYAGTGPAGDVRADGAHRRGGDP